MKILFLTDSLSLPRRSKTETVEWENVYPNLLKKSFPDIEFIHIGIGGATITELLRLQNYYALIPADIIVLQTGIVDCTPRALGKLEQQIIRKLHLVRLFNPFIALLRKIRKHTYTTPQNFEKALIKLKEIHMHATFISLGILPANSEYEKIAPGISKNILTYNEILKRHTVYVDNHVFPKDGILDDFHHLNEKGHLIIFKKLSEIILAHNSIDYSAYEKIALKK